MGALAARGSPGAGRAAGAGRRAQPVGPEQERLGERLLSRHRPLDGVELAQLPLRLVRPERLDDGRQTAARTMGAGAVGPVLRLPLAERAGAAGADGHGERWIGL